MGLGYLVHQPGALNWAGSAIRGFGTFNLGLRARKSLEPGHRTGHNPPTVSRTGSPSRSTVRWQLPVSLAFLPSTLGPACTYASLTMKYFWYATCHLCVLR